MRLLSNTYLSDFHKPLLLCRVRSGFCLKWRIAACCSIYFTLLSTQLNSVLWTVMHVIIIACYLLFFFYDWIIGVNHIYAQSQVEMYHSNGPMARTKKRRPIKNLSSDHKFDYKIIYCSAKVNSPSFPSLPSPPHHTLTQIDSIYKRNRMHQIKLKINLQFVFQVFCTLALSPQQHTL